MKMTKTKKKKKIKWKLQRNLLHKKKRVRKSAIKSGSSEDDVSSDDYVGDPNVPKVLKTYVPILLH